MNTDLFDTDTDWGTKGGSTTNTGLIEAAKEEGIFLLTQKGDHLIVANNQVKAF